MSETRTIFDPFELKNVEISNRLVDRLRGKYASGPHLPNGNPEFGWRQFQAPPIQHEAAAEIERLTAIVSDLVKAAEPCLNAWERFECGDVEIDAEWLRSEIADGLTWGDLRSLSEAVARAGKEVK